MQNSVLEIKNLYKTYPRQQNSAINNVSFRASQSERIGIIGANGSGKTTLFRLILNLIRPDSGEILIKGDSNLEAAKEHLGFVPEHQEGLENFTPEELLYLAGEMAGMPTDHIINRGHELLDWIQLKDRRSELLQSFSKGMVQRLQLALALIHSPSILLLDEPMSGLDPSGQASLRELLIKLHRYALLYASHNLADVEEICERVIILHQGQIIADIRLAEQTQEIFTVESEPSFLEILKNFPDVEIRNKRKTTGGLQLEFSAAQEVIQDLLARCKQQKIRVTRIKSRSVLEDLYNRYVNAE